MKMMMMILIAMVAFFMVTADAATKVACKPVPGTTLKEEKGCLAKIKACEKEGIIMKWTGPGCTVDGKLMSDGGCQCNEYCGYYCETACSADPQCYWSTKTNACYNAATGDLGLAIKVCLSTLKPSKAPTTWKPSRHPVTSKPSKSPTTTKPSKSPTTTKPSKSPTTSKPSTSPSSSPTNSPTTSSPSTSPTLSPTSSPTICNYGNTLESGQTLNPYNSPGDNCLISPNHEYIFVFQYGDGNWVTYDYPFGNGYKWTSGTNGCTTGDMGGFTISDNCVIQTTCTTPTSTPTPGTYTMPPTPTPTAGFSDCYLTLTPTGELQLRGTSGGSDTLLFEEP